MSRMRARVERAHEHRTILLIATLSALVRLVLIFRTDHQLASRPYIEDAFYALSCARHLALGHGFTVDGIHPTNGVQPLICLLHASCFLLTDDRWLAVRGTMLLGAAIQFVSVLLVARLVQRMTTNDHAPSSWLTPPVVGALLYGFAAPFFVHHLNGLETGLYAALILAAFLAHENVERNGWNVIRAAVFGGLLGILILARIDAVFLVLAFAFYHLWRCRAQAVLWIMSYGVTALLVSGPWWVYNYRTFGSLMPVSGRSEAIATPIVENLLQTLAALFDVMTLGLYHNYYAWPAWLTVLAFIAALAVWSVLFRSVWQDGVRVPTSLLAPFALFGLGLATFYVFRFGAPHFIARYLDPVRVLMVLLAAVTLPRIAMSQKAVGKPIRFALVLGACILAAFSVWRFQYDLLGAPNSDLYAIGEWSTHRTGTIGMMQSGTAGFVSERVVNLDGKVNAEALEARRRGALGAYIAKEGFTYLADWEPLVTPLVRAASEAGVRYELIDSIRYVQIYRRCDNKGTSPDPMASPKASR